MRLSEFRLKRAAERAVVPRLPDGFQVVLEQPIVPTSKRLVITIATGEKYQRILNLTSGLMAAYARKCGADFIALTNTTQSWPLYEKFRVGWFARQYEQTLFVDVDTIIRPTCPNLFDIVPRGHVAMHNDSPHNLDHLWMIPKWADVMASQGVNRPLGDNPLTLNTGVVLCDRETAHIWDAPARPLPGTHEDEQIWIQSTIESRNVSVWLLPQEFHHQQYFRDFETFLPRAQIIHYVLAENRELRIEDMLRTMNWTPLPPTMKSPQDRRPSIWRQGVLQIHVTRACDKACFGCTQGSNLAGKPVMITPEQFEQACVSVKDYFGVVGVFGGNPTMHPQFDELCRIMRKHIPFEQRGLWCNKLHGKGAVARETFNPHVSNLNVHLDQSAHDEFLRDWPESFGIVKGLDQDSRHSPPFVAMQDVISDEAERWQLIGNCDVNQFWSSMICVFRGELRGFFCELAAAQAMLHQREPDYPDLGVKIVPGWWDKGMWAFDAQVRHHCHGCGIPLRGFGSLAVNGEREQVSRTHASIYQPKRAGRPVELVQLRDQLGESALARATDYIENGALS